MLEEASQGELLQAGDAEGSQNRTKRFIYSNLLVLNMAIDKTLAQRNELLALLSGRKITELWQFFLARPAEWFAQADVLRQTGSSKAIGIDCLARLERAGVIVRQQKGRYKNYALSAGPLNKAVKRAATLIALKPLAALDKAYLFGSAARGEDGPESDIDILVVGDEPKAHVLRLTEPLARKLGRQIVPIVLTAAAWTAMRKQDPAFFERVEQDKILLTEERAG